MDTNEFQNKRRKEFRESPKGEAQKAVFKEYRYRSGLSYFEIGERWSWGKDTIKGFAQANAKFDHYHLMNDIFPEIPDHGFETVEDFKVYLGKIDHYLPIKWKKTINEDGNPEHEKELNEEELPQLNPSFVKTIKSVQEQMKPLQKMFNDVSEWQKSLPKISLFPFEDENRPDA